MQAPLSIPAHTFINDTSVPGKPQDLEQGLNPGQGCPQAVSSEDQGTGCPCFFGINVRNDNLDTPESQNTEPESNPGQNPLQTARLIVQEHDNLLPIDKVVASPPLPEPLAVTQDSASNLPVQDARNFPEVPTPDTGSLLGKMYKFPNESYSKLPQSPGRGTEPDEAPNT
ncbi:hypothetical protein DSO57_1020290 [Entomophthora muscae]|uniref:Uncharacterized protein n=1 Tax=Entomophthora muscae TaxID=34485 RepID=A0ACC2RUZ2_9FUNG|nr:hypothetical protein DSO57_1020290 [Entomophthora muscae]